MRSALFCLSLTIAVVLAVSAKEPTAVATDVSPSTKAVGACHIEQAGAYHALAEISEKAGVPIGVEAVLPKKEPTIVIDFPGGSAADLLNMFVAKAPDYTWADTGSGMIHVSRNNGHISLLDVVMAYPGADHKTRQQVWEDLAKRPEVSAWMNSSHCTRGELFQGGEFRSHNEPISIAPGDLTVEQLLDYVTVKSGENYWAVLQSAGPSNSCQVAIILW
jgi:hypothetical protein